MIVFDAPPPPPHMPLITTEPHHQAVEVAIRIARLEFFCPENTDPMIWLRLCQRHGGDVTFVVTLRGGQAMPIGVIDGNDAGGVDVSQHQVVRGAVGVLYLAALLSSLAAP